MTRTARPPRHQVLIVDDSLTVRMDLGEAFEAAGFAPTLAATATAARDALAQARFALIVLDVVLPDADGIELLGELRAVPATTATPVMLLSSEAEVKDRIRGLSTGAEEFVGKPYDVGYVVARARELVRSHAPGADPPGPATILIIDDSCAFREGLTDTLEEAGYHVLTASSGEEGLQIAADARPGAVVVDSVLPGVDGVAVVRRLRLDAALRLTPCLLLTASEERDVELRALDAGADAFVRKDADAAVILTRIGALLRGAQAPVIGRVASLLGPKRILAVDDSPTYLHELAEQLRAEGYDVVMASSGQEALALLAVQPVDCILLDLVMPGLSGEETCRQIKSMPPFRNLPLIILTAREGREAMIDGMNAGADDYIAKSTEFEVLRARLRAQLRRKHFEDENRQIREQLLCRELEASEARAARELAEVRAALLADLERTNDELARANAELNAINHELEAFSYSVSHDLRAPVRHISGFVGIVRERAAPILDEQSQRCLAQASEAALHMGTLIDELLSFSRMGRVAMSKRPVRLDALVDDVLRQLEPEMRGRDIDWVVGPLAEVSADPSMLHLVLTNLLSNAVKFTRTRSPARIEIGTLRSGDERPAGHLASSELCSLASEVVCFIRDNGVGFEMEYVQKLFGVFQRLHHASDFEGTGVGLANVRRIVQRHGGQTWAEGKVGEGAVFYFSLPNDPGGEG